MSLRDDNLRATLYKVLGDLIADAVRDERVRHLADLANSYDDTGTRSFDVKLPDGVKVATISLTIPRAHTDIVDPEALLKHAQSAGYRWLIKTVHHPEVPEQVIPAVPAHDEEVLDGDRVAEWLTAVKPVDRTGPSPVVDPDTGEIVPGVTYTPEDEPKSYAVRVAERDEVLRAFRRGDLDHLLDGTSVLPVLGGAR